MGRSSESRNLTGEMDLFSLKFDFDFFNNQPLFTLTLYYIAALMILNYGRQLLDLCAPANGIVHTFCAEFLSVTLFCTCAYQNALVVKNYDRGGFIFIVYTLMSFGVMLNPGTFSNPLRPLELMIRNKMPINKGAAILIAQLCGAVSGPSIATGIWYYTQNFYKDHAMLYRSLPSCSFNYKVPLEYAFVYEIFASFIIRSAVDRLPKDSSPLLLPALVSTLLTVALVNIGVPGINPIVVTSRMFGCRGLSEQMFLYLYWCCPALGWYLATLVEPRRQEPATPPPVAAVPSGNQLVQRIQQQQEQQEQERKQEGVQQGRRRKLKNK